MKKLEKLIERFSVDDMEFQMFFDHDKNSVIYKVCKDEKIYPINRRTFELHKQLYFDLKK
mgnify:CR=1 FL=1